MDFQTFDDFVTALPGVSYDYPFDEKVRVYRIGGKIFALTSEATPLSLYYLDEVDYMDLGYHSAMLESKFAKKIDIVALNDIYQKDPLFGFEILNNHIPILIKDEAKYISFKTACQLYYLDHLPLIQMQKEAFLQRIKNDKIGERNFVTET